MVRYLLFVQCSPKEGQDEEFNRWYDERHLKDICAIPGVTGARRYESAGIDRVSPPQPYATIYELDTEQPEAILAAIRSGGIDGTIPVSDALDRSSARLWLLKQR